MSNLNEYVAKLADTEESERSYAAEDLGYLNVPDAVAPLLERIQVENSPVVRDTIYQALVRIEHDEAIAGSLQLLESEDARIRNLAVSVLQRKGERALPFLKQAMRGPDHDIRKFVLEALRGIQSSAADEIYSAALSDPDINVVITAVENVGDLHLTRFCGQITNLLRPAAHPMLVAACLEALTAVGDGYSLAAIRHQFPDLAVLPQFLLSPCLRALAALGGEAEFNDILDLLPKRPAHLCTPLLSALVTLHGRGIYLNSPPPEPAESVLEKLRTMIERGESPLYRYRATRVLGFWVEHSDICGYLVSCLANLDRSVRLAAAEALRESNHPEVEEALAAQEGKESSREGAA